MRWWERGKEEARSCHGSVVSWVLYICRCSGRMTVRWPVRVSLRHDDSMFYVRDNEALSEISR